MTISFPSSSIDVKAGVYEVTPLLSLANSALAPYFTVSPITLTIYRAAISLASITAAGKTYDGTTAANINGGSFTGLVGNETLAISGAGSFDTKNAGAGKTVTVTDVAAMTKVNGTGDWDNYNLTTTGSKTALADIAQRNVTLDSITAAGKTYDGNDTASITGGAIGNTAQNETLAISGTGSFDTKNAGTGKTVTVTDVAAMTKTDGTGDWDNYNLTTTGSKTALADIAKAALTMTDTVATGTTYNGTTAANLSGGTLVGVVGTEDVTLTQAGTYASANAGTQSITANASLGGNANVLSNYTLTQATGLSATIERAALTLAGVTATNRAYNGNTDATLGGTATGLVLGQSLTLSGQFASKNAGTGIAVSVSIGDGADNSGLASNYSISETAQTVIADITPAPSTPPVVTPSLTPPSSTTPKPPKNKTPNPEPMVSVLGANPTVSELTDNTSTTTETSENGVNVIIKELADGRRSLKIVNGGMAPSRLEVDTGNSDDDDPKTAVLVDG